MLSFKDKIRPFRTMKLLVQLCEARATIIKQLEAIRERNESLLEMQKEMNAALTNCVKLQTGLLQKQREEIALLKADTGSSVDGQPYIN